MFLGSHLRDSQWCWFLTLPSSADGSPWLWRLCCVSFLAPQPVSPMLCNKEKQAPLRPYSCLVPLLIQKKDCITFVCKGITPQPDVLVFFYYYESLIFSSHCFQRQYCILLMKYFTYICSDLINTPELEVHQCYSKYLFELSFRQSYPSLIQMLQSINDKKLFQRNLHCSHHQSE